VRGDISYRQAEETLKRELKITPGNTLKRLAKQAGLNV